jgi:opacity protein-like surface antigen
MKLVFSLLILFSATASALAQESPRVEVFGGFSYLRDDWDSDDIRDLRGWNASVNYNLNSILGVKADFSGHYNNRTYGFGVPVDIASYEVREKDYTFLFGPQFSYRKNERIVPFAHVLLGVRRRTISTSLYDIGFETINDSFSDNAFSTAFGGGLDLKLTKRMAVRLVQADYLLSRFYGRTQNNLRIGTGLVVRF